MSLSPTCAPLGPCLSVRGVKIKFLRESVIFLATICSVTEYLDCFTWHMYQPRSFSWTLFMCKYLRAREMKKLSLNFDPYHLFSPGLEREILGFLVITLLWMVKMVWVSTLTQATWVYQDQDQGSSQLCEKESTPRRIGWSIGISVRIGHLEGFLRFR